MFKLITKKKVPLQFKSSGIWHHVDRQITVRLANIYQLTQHHISQDLIFHQHQCEKFKFPHKTYFFVVHLTTLSVTHASNHSMTANNKVRNVLKEAVMA